jgi:hypothetical protein
MDISKAFSTESGIIIDEQNGGPFFTGGTASPVGLDLPTQTVYVRPTANGPEIWRKFGAGVNDWRILSAQDIFALNSLLQNSNVQAVLDSLGAGGGSGVSMTLQFGQGGNTSQNSYLPSGGIPSNIVGFPIGLSSPVLRSIYLGNENIRTGNVVIQQRYPALTGSWVTIYTLSLLNEQYKAAKGLSVILQEDGELAVFTEISLKSAKVVLNVKGNTV